jgi:hypothetical protein
MPAATPCPVSNIDRALSSYVHSREETLKIRRTLAKYLTASLRPANTSARNHHVNHECPQILSAASTNPPGLRGVRNEYLEALRTKSAAQARLRELQASLNELQNRHISKPPTKTDSQQDSESIRNYVNLVRRRGSFAELQLIQDSLEKLLNANPIDSSKGPRTLVTKAIGEQPDPPAQQLEKLSDLDEDANVILKVKKEVLEASSSMERANAARVEAQNASRESPNLEEQIYALGCARDEMVEWVQEELSKMEEESGFFEDASPVKRSIVSDSGLDLASSEHLIRETYEHYTASRAATIRSHESIQHPQSSQGSTSNHGSHVVKNKEDQELQNQPTRIFTKLLSHLPNLSHVDNNERALLQQAVYLQTQINSTDEETGEHLSRLAGESHLLPSGSKGVESWGKVAVEIEKTNENFIHDQVLDSRQEINLITTIVDLCSLQSQVLSSA